MTAVGASGLPVLTDTFVRLTSPVVSFAKDPRLRPGREQRFVLACDMARVAREHRLGQPEVGVDCIPVAGGTSASPSGRPRSRAWKSFSERTTSMVTTAERYGYVNRALPDAELDGFVDALARRIAPSTGVAIGQRRSRQPVSLPQPIGSWTPSLRWSSADVAEAQHRIEACWSGTAGDANFEKTWPDILAHLARQEKEARRG